MRDNSFLAFVAGAAIGAAVAVLFAPDKGSVTRRRLKNMAEEEKEKFLDLVYEGKEKIMDMVDEGKEKLADLVDSERGMVADAMEYGKDKVERIQRAVCKK